MSSSITKKKKKKERKINMEQFNFDRNEIEKNKMQQETLTSFEAKENFISILLDRVFRWQKNNKVELTLQRCAQAIDIFHRGTIQPPRFRGEWRKSRQVERCRRVDQPISFPTVWYSRIHVKPLGSTRPVDEGKKLTGRCDLNDRHFIKTREYTLSAINVPRT